MSNQKNEWMNSGLDTEVDDVLKNKQQSKQILNKEERVNARLSLESKAMLITLAKLNHTNISELIDMLVDDASRRVPDKEKLEDIYLNELSILIGKNQKNVEERSDFYDANRKAETDNFVREAEKYFGMPIKEVPIKDRRDYIESKYDYIIEEMSRYALYPICRKFGIERLTILNRVRKNELQRKIIREARIDTGKTIDEFSREEALDYICKKTDYGKSKDSILYYQMFGITRSKFFKRCEELKKATE